MFKVFLFSIILIFLSLIAGWVGTKPGSVRIIWLDYDIKTSISVTLVFLSIIVLISFIFYNFIFSVIKTKNKIKKNIISNSGLFMLKLWQIADEMGARYDGDGSIELIGPAEPKYAKKNHQRCRCIYRKFSSTS